MDLLELVYFGRGERVLLLLAKKAHLFCSFGQVGVQVGPRESRTLHFGTLGGILWRWTSSLAPWAVRGDSGVATPVLLDILGRFFSQVKTATFLHHLLDLLIIDGASTGGRILARSFIRLLLVA